MPFSIINDQHLGSEGAGYGFPHPYAFRESRNAGAGGPVIISFITTHMKIDRHTLSAFKKPLATLAIIGAVGVTAGITSIASAAVATPAANASVGVVAGAKDIGMGMDRRMPGVMGIASSVTGATIMVAGKDGTNYTVDASGATFRKGGVAGTATATIADIKAGDTVKIRGTVSGTAVTATDAMDGVMPIRMGGRGGMGHKGVHGTVSAINGTTITITNADGMSYTVDASKATVTKTVSEAVSDIKVGDTLGVDGTVNGTSVTAVHIMAGAFPKGLQVGTVAGQ